MVLSIMHRISGIAMSVGLIVLVAWLYDAAAGPEAYSVFSTVMGSAVGKLMLIAWSLAFFYHLSNGVRHLFWDMGRGFEKEQANNSSWLVLAMTIVLTAVFWWAAS
jgi:succinate dehydrogenase / fumarate reductase cytochrome b subunit